MAITKCHILGGLHKTFMFSQFCRLRSPRYGISRFGVVSQGHPVSSQGGRGRGALWGLLYNDIESESCSRVPDSLRPHGLYSLWNSPGQNAGVDGHSLLQGIFPTQESNPGLPHCRGILYPTEKPKNTGMCSLSLLHQIFPIQESNWGLLHCR